MDTNVQYKCPNCGAALVYDAEGEQMKCESCDNVFSVEAAEAFTNAESSDRAFDWGDYKFNVADERLDETVSYICKSCGAEIEAVGTTIATHCPYCDNEVVISEKANDVLKPNGVIPFKIDKKKLPEVIKEFYKKRKLLPKGFIDENKLREIQGVYVPFWLYNCSISGTAMLNAEKIITHRSGDYIITDTFHYLLEREGGMSFENIPADASIKMDNNLMDSLEPFDFSEIVPYSSGYLSGYLADRFDTSPEDESQRASVRMDKSLTDVLKNDSAGYTSVSLRSKNMQITQPDIRYVLLPVYLINTEYDGKKYQLAVNGQTGKVVGEVPICKKKKAMFFWRAFAIAAAIAAVLAIILKLLGVL